MGGEPFMDGDVLGVGCIDSLDYKGEGMKLTNGKLAVSEADA